jgi:phosphate transport system substrate-binding protein
LLPTKKNISAHEYLLARTVQMYIHQAPNQLPDPKVMEFIRYLLSSDGQAVIARNGAYLPLPETLALTELGKMK